MGQSYCFLLNGFPTMCILAFVRCCLILFFPDKAVETNEAVIEFVKHVDTFFDAYCDVIESALLCGNLRKNRKAKKK